MNFLACEGDWTLRPDGTAACAGTLHSLTREEMRTEVGSALTWDQVAELQGEVITLFALAFGFLVLKRLLK